VIGPGRPSLPLHVEVVTGARSGEAELVQHAEPSRPTPAGTGRSNHKIANRLRSGRRWRGGCVAVRRRRRGRCAAGSSWPAPRVRRTRTWRPSWVRRGMRWACSGPGSWNTERVAAVVTAMLEAIPGGWKAPDRDPQRAGQAPGTAPAQRHAAPMTAPHVVQRCRRAARRSAGRWAALVPLGPRSSRGGSGPWPAMATAADPAGLLAWADETAAPRTTAARTGRGGPLAAGLPECNHASLAHNKPRVPAEADEHYWRSFRGQTADQVHCTQTASTRGGREQPPVRSWVRCWSRRVVRCVANRTGSCRPPRAPGVARPAAERSDDRVEQPADGRLRRAARVHAESGGHRDR
jgi:hypothetical protein